MIRLTASSEGSAGQKKDNNAKYQVWGHSSLLGLSAGHHVQLSTFQIPRDSVHAVGAGPAMDADRLIDWNLYTL